MHLDLVMFHWALLFCLLVVGTMQCGPGEFQCSHVADGCVPLEALNDGRTDCIRDGSDETKESYDVIASCDYGVLFCFVRA